MQLEIPMDTVEFVAKMASKKNKRVILNPAPAQTLSAALLRHLYMITPNETEAEMISGVKITDEVSAKKAAQVIGALIYCDSMVDMVPAIKVEAVDTTAAGDIFNGALTVALAEGRDLREAVRFACKASAISVTRVGAQSSAPYRNEVDIFD